MGDQLEACELVSASLLQEMRCRRHWRDELDVTPALYVGQPRESLQVLTTQIAGCTPFRDSRNAVMDEAQGRSHELG